MSDAASITLPAHAKINLLLRILAREAGGFHGLETVFQRLALHDEVTVRVGGADRRLSCTGPTLPPSGLGAPEENLAWRAAAAYADASGWHTGWEITIDKRIPVGGGLGGGSADAAAVLRALEALSPAPLGRDALLALGGTLGSDVPFFVADTSRALAWGRGDRLLPLAPLPPMAVLLVTFADGVHTGRAYGAFAQARGAAHVAAAAYDMDTFATWGGHAAVAANDFERVVPSLHDGVAEWLPVLAVEARRLREAGHPAIGLLSGSGATCFLLAAADVLPALPTPSAAGGVRLVRTTTA